MTAPGNLGAAHSHAQSRTDPDVRQRDQVRRFRLVLLIAALCLAGLILRLAALALAPEYAFLSDHVDYMAWSQYAYEHGPTAIYDAPAGNLINANLPAWQEGHRLTTPYPSYNRCNYPPLAAYAFWLQGCVWSLLDRPATLPPRADIAARVDYEGGPVTSRVANTFTARLTNAFLALLTDFLWAAGVAKLLRRFRPQSRNAAIWAFGIALLAPPVFLDSAFWNQTDSWLACGMVWSVYFLATRRYAAAGVVYGATALLKAQAVLLAPVLGYALVDLAISQRRRCLRRAVPVFLAGFLVTVAVLAAPFSLAERGGGEMGWARWIRRAYVQPIQSDFPFTTLKAFNVWWLDLVAHGGTQQALNAQGLLFGVSRDAVGRVVLGGALVLAAFVCARRAGWSPAAWQLFAVLALLAAFLFPTRVHERYIYYAVPFAIVGTLLYRPWLPVLITLLLVATCEVTWYLWYAPGFAAPWDPPKSSGAGAWSVLLSLLLLSAFAYAAITLWRNRTISLSGSDADGLDIP